MSSKRHTCKYSVVLEKYMRKRKKKMCFLLLSSPAFLCLGEEHPTSRWHCHGVRLSWMTWGRILKQCFCMRPLCTSWEWKTTSIHVPLAMWEHLKLASALVASAFLLSNKNSKYKKVSLFSLENCFLMENEPGTHHPYVASLSLTDLMRWFIWTTGWFLSWPQGSCPFACWSYLKGYPKNLKANMSNTVSFWFSMLPVPDHLSPSLLCKSHIGYLFLQKEKPVPSLIFLSSTSPNSASLACATSQTYLLFIICFDPSGCCYFSPGQLGQHIH